MSINAALSLPPDGVKKGQDLYNYIFKDANNAMFIDSSLEAIESQTVDMGSSNVRIYCDQDSRWVQAPSAIVPGNDNRPDNAKAWYDPINNMVWDNNVAPKPGCMGGGSTGITFAQTYSNCLSDKDRHTITLCNVATSEINLFGLYKLQGRDVANPNKPGVIDAYTTTSSTNLHELAHTLKNPMGDLGEKWVDHAYKWAGITSLPAYLATSNADSLAYLGLGATIQSNFPNILNEDGSVS